VREERGLVALVQFELATGRTHQIRVHAAKAGCPVLGDRTYGGARHLTLNRGAVVTARRVMLHAQSVQIPGRPQWIEAPFEDDWLALWSSL
jgi:23S rRNA pseudouridine955/2504/2580 synthase/23S rRNA pseudouridine1911/1915/1917 synthase